MEPLCTEQCASFKKTCLFERVTSQWRYERRDESERTGERGKEKQRGEVTEQTGKVGQGENEKDAEKGKLW